MNTASFEYKLDKLVQQAELKIIRKIIAYNKRKGNKKHFDLPYLLSNENVMFNVFGGWIDKVAIIGNELRFVCNNNNYHTLEKEQILLIADTL